MSQRANELTQSSIPVINRQMPLIGRIISMIVVFGIAVPIDWICRKLGLSPVMVGLMRRFRARRSWDEVFAGYVPTAHDVFVSTFAKSGTNWMMQIAHQIAFRGEAEYENIHDVVSWPDMDTGRKRSMSIKLDDDLVRRVSPTGLRVIKTHLSADHVPYSEQARYLVVLRDPKEVFVSSYFFAGGAAGPLMPTPQVWFDLYVSGRFPLDFGSNWAEHAASYWALRDKPNVLILKFSEMKQDLGEAVRRVAALLGVELTEAEFARVVEKSSFAYMKGINHKFAPMAPGSLPWADGFTMMREGKSGNSKEMLSVAQQAKIDEYFQAELAKLGSDFPYEEFFNVVRTSAEAASAA